MWSRDVQPEKCVIISLIQSIEMTGKVSIIIYYLDKNLNKISSHILATLENVQILETVSDDTLVFLQTHKRIWPASQRDALFWSHMKKVEEDLDPETKDMWIVCNHSTLNPDYPR